MAKRTAEERQAALDAHYKRVVDAWPPLSNEQLDKLAILLRPAPPRRDGRPAVERMLGGER